MGSIGKHKHVSGRCVCRIGHLSTARSKLLLYALRDRLIDRVIQNLETAACSARIQPLMFAADEELRSITIPGLPGWRPEIQSGRPPKCQNAKPTCLFYAVAQRNRSYCSNDIHCHVRKNCRYIQNFELL